MVRARHGPLEYIRFCAEISRFSMKSVLKSWFEGKFGFKKKELARRRSWLCINSISFPSTTTALFHCCKLYYQAFVVSTAIVVTKAVAYLD